MSLRLKVEIRNARTDLIRDAIDAAATPGYFEVYTGPVPATGAAITTQTLLATIMFPKPCAPNTDSGVLTFNAIAAVTTTAGGLPGFVRVYDGDSNFVMDASAGLSGSGAVFIFNAEALAAARELEVVSLVITAGNA